ncbi:hypothetical protein [Hominifimenecus sp. rT4P-3]|uniref:hypothetical protein n=1 Tax=Hominifimenecus sp. rT4P-3 TaxID=3242979 RepID=UPI003DA42BD8
MLPVNRSNQETQLLKRKDLFPMTQNSKTSKSSSGSSSPKRKKSSELPSGKLSLSGELQITNLNQIRTQLDSLTKKRFVELEVKLTGDGADFLKNPQIRTGPVQVQTTAAPSNTSSSKSTSSKPSLFDSSAQGRALVAASTPLIRDAGEG